MKYRVHVYAVVRVPLEIEADTQEEAVKLAYASFVEDDIRNGEAEFAEELQNNYLVDEEGDTQYERSTWWRFDDDGEVKPMDFLANTTGGNA